MSNIDPIHEGLIKVVIPDTTSTRQILDIVYWLGSDYIHTVVADVVNGNNIYFKHEDDAIMFRLRFGI